MDKLLTAAQMQYCDRYRIESGLPSLVLMERAALAVHRRIREKKADTARTVILAGTGNNGADGVALARLLAEEGEHPVVVLAGDRSRATEQMLVQLEALACYDVPVVPSYEGEEPTLIVDALFGIGLSRDITGQAAELIAWANARKAYRVAVDIPSGISADNGSVQGCAFMADMTVTFAAAKRGHYLYPGRTYTGALYIEPIGILIPDKPETGNVYRVSPEDLQDLPKRPEDGHKGTFGKLLVIAGNGEIGGAAFLSAAAALRSGTGMVMVYTHENNRTAILSLLPEALVLTYRTGEETENLSRALAWADGVVIGPGIGTDTAAAGLFAAFLQENTLPAVFDADALTLLSRQDNMKNRPAFPVTVTPHMGEMSRLTGKSVEALRQDRIKAASDYALKTGFTCVLKDAVTVTAYPDGRVMVNTTGCSALSTAGSGDVLSGILGSFLVQYDRYGLSWAALGVCFHGLLGELAAAKASESGTTAKALTDLLPEAARLLDGGEAAE